MDKEKCYVEDFHAHMSETGDKVELGERSMLYADQLIKDLLDAKKKSKFAYSLQDMHIYANVCKHVSIKEKSEQINMDMLLRVVAPLITKSIKETGSPRSFALQAIEESLNDSEKHFLIFLIRVLEEEGMAEEINKAFGVARYAIDKYKPPMNEKEMARTLLLNPYWYEIVVRGNAVSRLLDTDKPLKFHSVEKMIKKANQLLREKKKFTIYAYSGNTDMGDDKGYAKNKINPDVVMHKLDSIVSESKNDTAGLEDPETGKITHKVEFDYTNEQKERRKLYKKLTPYGIIAEKKLHGHDLDILEYNDAVIAMFAWFAHPKSTKPSRDFKFVKWSTADE